MHNDALSCCLLHKPLPVFQQHCLRQSINFLVREILFACEIEAVSFNIFSPPFFFLIILGFLFLLKSSPDLQSHKLLAHNCSALHRRESSVEELPQIKGDLHCRPSLEQVTGQPSWVSAFPLNSYHTLLWAPGVTQHWSFHLATSPPRSVPWAIRYHMLSTLRLSTVQTPFQPFTSRNCSLLPRS